MTFEQISKLAFFLAKDYAKDIFKMLQIYPDVSASEAASRLDTHIKTAQDFLEGLFEAGILSREEVYEKKRPYFRYTLATSEIKINFKFDELLEGSQIADTSKLIKEKKETGAIFTSSNRTSILSSIKIFTGKGRDKKERKISLSENQGKFLFFLPFPTEKPASIQSILDKAGLSGSNLHEINDIIRLLTGYDIIEII